RRYLYGRKPALVMRTSDCNSELTPLRCPTAGMMTAYCEVAPFDDTGVTGVTRLTEIGMIAVVPFVRTAADTPSMLTMIVAMNVPFGSSEGSMTTSSVTPLGGSTPLGGVTNSHGRS